MNSTTPPQAHRIRTLAVYCALIAFVAIVVYGNHLHNPFQFDSVYYITTKKALDQPEKILTLTHWKEEYFSRSLLQVSLALNAWLGDKAPFGYHLANLLLHSLNAILVLFISLRVLQYFHISRLGIGESESRMIALFTALLFLCHPIQTESVLYIMSRGGILAATFFLGAFLVWQNFLHQPVQTRTHSARWTSFSAILVLFVIGFSAKQNVATLPAILGLYYLAGCPPGSAPLRFLNRWKWAIMLILGLGFIFLMRKLLSDESFLIGPTDPGEILSRKVYMLSQPAVVVLYYFKLFLFPVNLNIDPDIPVIRTILDARFLVAILVIMAIAIASIRVKTSRMFLFCCTWFFIVLSPSSSIVTLQDLAAEHRVYLASIGVFLFLAIGLVQATRNMGAIRKSWTLGKTILPLAVLVLLAVMTTNRNYDWRSEQALWTDAMTKSPQLTRPIINLARAASLAGENDRAEAYYRQALAKRPDVFVTHYNLAELILKQDKQEEAIALLEKAKNLEPKIPETYGKLGEVYLQRGQYLLAEKNLRQAVELNPQYPTAIRNLGVVNYYHLGRKQDGLLYFARSLTLDPRQAQADEIRKLLQKSP